MNRYFSFFRLKINIKPYFRWGTRLKWLEGYISPLNSFLRPFCPHYRILRFLVEMTNLTKKAEIREYLIFFGPKMP